MGTVSGSVKKRIRMLACRSRPPEIRASVDSLEQLAALRETVPLTGLSEAAQQCPMEAPVGAQQFMFCGGRLLPVMEHDTPSEAAAVRQVPADTGEASRIARSQATTSSVTCLMFRMNDLRGPLMKSVRYVTLDSNLCHHCGHFGPNMHPSRRTDATSGQLLGP